MTTSELVTVLTKLRENVKFSGFRKHPRGPKKPQPKRKSCKNSPQVSTAGLLAERKKKYYPERDGDTNGYFKST
jgi:hypothetical protein